MLADANFAARVHPKICVIRVVVARRFVKQGSTLVTNRPV